MSTETPDNPPRLQLLAGGKTDVGRQREHNEDAYCMLREHELFIVADGMGGHQAGDVASQMAVDTIREFFQVTAKEDSTWPFQFDPNLSIEENRLVMGIKLANRQIFEASTRDRTVHGMGTTVVGAFFAPERKKIFVAHVGDSRAYRIRRGEITLLTRDHSLYNDYMLVMPDMPEQQKELLPRNVITRALGIQDTVVVDLVPEEPEVGDVYVLCSDGLTGMVSDEVICSTISTNANNENIEQTAQQLIDLANENGGDDNVTVVLIGFTENKQPE